MKKLKSSPWFRLALTSLVVLLFVYYFVQHKQDFRKLLDISPVHILFILIGQLIVVASNVGILVVLVRMASKRIKLLPATRVIGYSSVINFFGFLQGGLGFRGVYLKQKLDISLKTYSVLTLLQYAILFGLTGLMIGAGFLAIYPQNLGLVAVGTTAIFIVGGAVFYAARFGKLPGMSKIEQVWPLATKHKKAIGLLLVLAIIQLAGSMLAFGVELRALGAQFSLPALLIYTGLAQFSILFAVTPGAIGVREALLLLVAQQIGITTQTVILASTIDRLVYFITLACLLPFYFSVRKTKNS